MPKLNLKILDNEFSIHRFDPSSEIPEKILRSNFFWIGKTDEELSIVCESGLLPDILKCDTGWYVIKIIGPFELSIVGILAEITGTLALAGISIFAVSTYDTDYILVKKPDLPRAKEELKSAGYIFMP